MQKIKLILIALLGLAGTIDAAYLTNEAYKIKEKTMVFGGAGNDLGFACDVSTTFSCSSVFNENFAWIFGLPFSGIALAVYPVLIIIAILALLGKINNPYKILLIMSIGGLIFNGYVIFNEYFLGAYCLLCLGCTAIITTVLILSIIGIKNEKQVSSSN